MKCDERFISCDSDTPTCYQSVCSPHSETPTILLHILIPKTHSPHQRSYCPTPTYKQ